MIAIAFSCSAPLLFSHLSSYFFRYFNLKVIIQVFRVCCTIEHVYFLVPELGSSHTAIYDLFAFHVLVSLVDQDFEESICSWLLRISFVVLL